MSGSLIYRPDITDGDPVTTRIFQLTDPCDYEIALESAVIEPFFECHGRFIRSGSLTVTPWNPDFIPFNPKYPKKESLGRLARWRYQVRLSTTQPPSRAERCRVFHTDAWDHILIPI